jgi:hypothetical protein
MSLRRIAPAAVAATLLVFPLVARGEIEGPIPDADPELAAVQSAFDMGRFDLALQRARARIYRGELSSTDLVTLHRFAGLAALYLDKTEEAERHFCALLRISPDFVLDPFETPPTTVAFFEEVRKKLGPQLDLIREQQHLESERLRREAYERATKQKEEEERRRRLEELSRRVTVRTVEKRSFYVNFIPFGAGQFQQNRTGMGASLATLQGAAGLTSVISYFAWQGLLKEERISVQTTGGQSTVTREVIPKDRQHEANTWTLSKYGSAGLFYAVYAYGVIDAIAHHDDEVVTTTFVQLPSETLPVHPNPSRGTPAPSTSGFLYPVTGGLGAGISGRF